MKAITQKLIDRQEAAHDWDEGPVYGGPGTVLSCIAICRVCGIRRHWFSDRQNGISDRYTFEVGGQEISLYDVVAKPTCIEKAKVL